MHNVNNHFVSALAQLVRETNSNVITQRLKTNIELYEWVLREAPEHFESVASKVQWLLAGRPEVKCSQGSLKKWVPKTNQLGFCGNTKHCECFRQQVAEQGKSNDMHNVVAKRIATWQQNYGVDNPSRCEQSKNKRRITMTKRNYDKLYIRLKQDKQQQGFSQVLARLDGIVTPLFNFDQYSGSFRKNFYEWRCCKCNSEFSDHVDYGRVPRCPNCYPSHTSMAQLDLEQWLTQMGMQYQRGDKTVLNGRELDILISSHSVAIEFNGVYWHSDKFRDKNYHATKFLDCQRAGIRLIQIWEDEWKNKKSIVLSRLTSVLGKDLKIFARKCVIDTEVSSTEHREFLQKHHLQGYASASVVIGLRHNQTLVAVMSFSKSRYTEAPWELIRYASAGSVIGGASKLFKAFVKMHNPSSVVSYANRCWSWGAMYQKLGFVETTPKQLNAGYWYVKNDQRFHRSNFTKKALIKQGFESTQTEMQLMKSMGYMVIWDAGNSRWTWTKPSCQC